MSKPKEVVGEWGQRAQRSIIGLSGCLPWPDKAQKFGWRLIDITAPLLWRRGPALVQQFDQHVPALIRTSVLQYLLRQVFAQRANLGELDFLQGKSVQIEVTDREMKGLKANPSSHSHPIECKPRLVCVYQIQLTPERTLQVHAPNSEPSNQTYDVLFRADASALLSLVTQQADADTLFFRRQLLVSGDTETGLHLKNYLDQISVEPLLPAVLLQVAERLLAHAP
ncbi:MAG TPA: hypothetical protein DCS87_15445 [Rheinheimera sp.]|nr:hypothetical protein [Rheinheimera sp.]